MIKPLLTQISKDIYNTENRTNNFYKYAKMRETPGWHVHQIFMLAIKNAMSEYLLGNKFTKLSIEEKDSQQRACHNTKEIIDFLFDPLKGAKLYIENERYTRKQKEATQRKSKGKS